MKPPIRKLKQKPVNPMKERIGFLDIETSYLKASLGYVISYCIKEKDGRMFECLITPHEIKSGVFDKELLKQFSNDITNFDRVCVYWGKDFRHNITSLRNRTLKANTDFPLYRDICVIDLYDWAKIRLSLHSYKLGVVCQELGIPAKEHSLDGTTWVRAMAGDQKALDSILTHNRENVVCMEPLYERLRPQHRLLSQLV